MFDVESIEKMLNELSKPLYTWRMSRAQLGTKSLSRSRAMHTQYDRSLEEIDRIVSAYVLGKGLNLPLKLEN